MKSHMRVCSRHFPDGNTDNPPNLTIGKRFSSPIKKQHPRAKRVKLREKSREIRKLSASRSASPSSESGTPTFNPGDQLEAEHTVHEPTECATTSTRTDVHIDRALLARIEFLEVENERLKKEAQKVNSQHFRIEQIKKDDNLVRFYIGFISLSLFLEFFEYLGDVVEHLNYWGEMGGCKRKRIRKLSTMNQLFLTFVKLKLNLKLQDLAFRFGLSPSQTSRYLTTLICFLYQHLKEL